MMQDRGSRSCGTMRRRRKSSWIKVSQSAVHIDSGRERILLKTKLEEGFCADYGESMRMQKTMSYIFAYLSCAARAFGISLLRQTCDYD